MRIFLILLIIMMAAIIHKSGNKACADYGDFVELPYKTISGKCYVKYKDEWFSQNSFDMRERM